MNRRVLFTAEARADLQNLYDWIADHSGLSVADTYVGSRRETCARLADFPMRGRALSPGRSRMRAYPVDRKAIILYAVRRDRVVISRVLYGGRDVGRATGLSEEAAAFIFGHHIAAVAVLGQHAPAHEESP